MDITQLLSSGTPALIALFLNVLGWIIKQSPLDNKWIPSILTLIGCIAYVSISGFTPSNIMIGVIIGASSVGFNQIVKQHTNDEKETTNQPVVGTKPGGS